MSSAISTFSFRSAPWEHRLSFFLEMMRELSRQTDPQTLVQTYGARMRQILPTDGFISLSRRDLRPPLYRITRSSRWGNKVNPWKQRDQLPIYDSGILGELLYADDATVIDDLDISPDDPAFEFLEGHRSLAAIPLFDGGTAINMVVQLRREPAAFDRELLPEHVWMSNLFGRAAQTLVLAGEVREAYEDVDRELRAVAEIQRSLLPTALPEIPGLELAAHYQTSRRAGGDYYDFFEQPDGSWGLLVADVSGHGTPAAVLMAVTHSIAHLSCEPRVPAGRLLASINARLAAAYTNETGNFVTAFYGIYCPRTRKIAFANAGHPPPRIRSADGTVRSLDGNGGLPLGILPNEAYHDSSTTLQPGDMLLLYTDGITEARDGSPDLFGISRLDQVMSACSGGPQDLIREVLAAVESYEKGTAPSDDRTLLAARLAP